MSHSLYMVRLPTNDYAPAYIGVTKNLTRRLRAHGRARTKLGAAIRECARSDIVVEILRRGSAADMYSDEVKAIRSFNLRWPNGYNMNAGGFGCRDPLPSTRAKIGAKNSLHLIGNTHRLGKPTAPEVVTRIAERVRGSKRTPEQRLRMAAAMRGKKRSADARKNMSLARLGNTNSKGSRRSLEQRARISSARMKYLDSIRQAEAG